MNTTAELIEDIRSGRMVVLIDDEDRENEGDLVLAADFVTPEAINFMVKEARGLVCLSLTHEQIERLQLPLMVREDSNFSPNKTAFTVSIEAAKGVSTGISAADRAHTIRIASRLDAKPSDVITPGHIFPIRAKDGGVLKRAGHTEGSIDLCRLAGLSPAAVICEVMNDDGSMARVGDLREFAKRHGLKIGTIVDLIRYRLENESLVEEVAHAKLPNRFGEDFQVRAFRSILDGTEHLVMQMGDLKGDEPPLVRVHSECMTGDVFGSTRCDCGPQLHKAMKMISDEGRGVILYLRQEGRGIGLGNKIRAYALQDQGYDTVEANLHLGFPPDARDYGIGAQILRAIGLSKIRLLTNNPSKRIGLKGYGIEAVGRVPLVVETHANNASYMNVKREKMGHVYESTED
ncbi:MAG: bifunctional 3,4-dihydroxy-2-butanone-4-phosphate synthase/GTP cyclohydrolase II [Bdellovibrionales bacterium]|jgi:3,4-dihydroxy 2-butanone 4-phosphate synthase/GTP cyclohydrolase II|nr:bifunctional 3,4-dihydroxy-2-butanone-4-phosphate synthase/GTP cyclohydrolase II [Bdellovibrionales bacterium]